MLRQLIEPYAAARAAESMNDETLRQLSAMEEEMDRIKTETGVAYARFAEADAMLHSLVATGSGNHLIAETIERLHMHLHIFRFLFNTNAPQEAAQEHAEIIHALLARDPAAAETAMRVHLGAVAHPHGRSLDPHRRPRLDRAAHGRRPPPRRSDGRRKHAISILPCCGSHPRRGGASIAIPAGDSAHMIPPISRFCGGLPSFMKNISCLKKSAETTISC